MTLTNPLELPIAKEPNQISAAFTAAFNTSNAENLQRLYEPAPTLIAVASPDENRYVNGVARDWFVELQNLVAIGGIIDSRCLYALQHGDIALVSAEWVVSGIKNAKGEAQPDIRGRSTEVVRRQPDGRWLYIIDHPTGASL